MKKLFILLVFLPHLLVAQQATVLSALEKLAERHQLELCYSPDLVDLKEVVDCPCDSLSLNDCVKRLSYLSHLDIAVEGKNLVVTHPGKQTNQMGGKVIDLNTGEELPFAHILQRDWGTGSISNAVGEFQVNVPKVLAGLNLEFSCLGYADTSVVIPESDTTQLVIHLRPKPYNINEVLVLPNGNTAEELVRQAAKSIKRNYHRRKCQMEAFYRRTGMRDSLFVQLIEAALRIEDKGIDMPSNTTKIKLEEVRKSRNYLVQKSADEQWTFKQMEKLWYGGHKNIFYECCSDNPVRKYNEEEYYKPLTDYTNFRYEFEGALWLDSIKVYKIRYDHGKEKPEKEVFGLIDGGYIYLNSQDLGVLKMSREFKVLSDPYGMQLDKISKHLFDSEWAFQQIEGKYYLKYIKRKAFPHSKVFVPKSTPVNSKKSEAMQWAEELLVVTNVMTTRQQRDRIRRKERLDAHENSIETNYLYNPEFWSTYGMLKQEPLPGKAIEDLEWEESLDVQFKENSTAHVKN